MMADSILLKGGVALIHGDDDFVKPTKTDILVKDGRIARIASDINDAQASHVLDCTDKVISPGFIDTHHHVWQTQLKGKHANQTLLQYFVPGNFSSSLFSADDTFWGQLAGCLETLDGGTTTVVDHAHINYSPEHSYAALSATLASGIRSVFGYCPTPRAKSLQPFEMDFNFLPDWVMGTFDKLAASMPFANERVMLGFAFDGLYLPKEMIQPVFKQVVEAGVKVFTTHGTVGAAFAGAPRKLDALKNLELLDPKMKTIISHSNDLSGEDAADLEKYNVSISNTPSSELQMGMMKTSNPMPVALSDSGLAPYCSVGIDCHSMVSGFIPAQLRELMSATRAHRHDQDYQQGKWHRALDSKRAGEGFPTVEQAFNVATIGGARAIGMVDQLGRIREGFKADLAIWDAMTPGMVAAAEEDPVAAVVFHSSPQDVYGAMVDGHLRKWDGKLTDVSLDGQALPGPLKEYHLPQAGTVTWKTVAKKIQESRKTIVKKLEGVDMKAAGDVIINMFHMNQATML